MKKLLSILLAALMLLSSVTVVMADGTTEYELYTGTDTDVYALQDAELPAADGLSKAGTGSDNGNFEYYIPQPPSLGMEVYGAFALRKTHTAGGSEYDPVAFSEVIEGDNLYDYELQLEVTRPSSIYVADLEIGIGNYKAEAKQASQFNNRSSVAKTAYLGNVLSGITKGTYQTIKVDIADVLANGREQKFVYNDDEPNELTAENANLILIRATSNVSSGTTLKFINIKSIKLVKKDYEANIPTVVDWRGSGKSFPGSEIPASTDGSYGVLIAQGSYKFSIKGKPAEGTIMYGHHSARVNSSTPFLVKSLFGDAKMEDYVLELTVKKLTDKNYVENIEFGLACCNVSSSYMKAPVSLKTVNAKFDETYNSLAEGQTATVYIPVKDIFEKGNFYNVSQTDKRDVTFAPENVTGVAMKANSSIQPSETTQQALSLEGIKFVRKTTDITIDEENAEISFSACDYSDAPALAGTQAIVAYYNDLDEDGVYTLDYCDVEALVAADANNAALTLPFDSNYGGAKMIKAFLFDSMNDITPITKAEVLIRE